MKRLFFLILISLFFGACKERKVNYTHTKKGTVADAYFDAVVTDPYRWLEDDNDAEVIKWIQNQDTFTEAYLNKIRERGKIKNRLAELWNHEKISATLQEKNTGNHPILIKININFGHVAGRKTTPS